MLPRRDRIRPIGWASCPCLGVVAPVALVAPKLRDDVVLINVMMMPVTIIIMLTISLMSSMALTLIMVMINGRDHDHASGRYHYQHNEYMRGHVRMGVCALGIASWDCASVLKQSRVAAARAWTPERSACV